MKKKCTCYSLRPVLLILVYCFNSNAGHLFYVGFVLSAYFNSYFSIHMVNRKRMSICIKFYLAGTWP